MYVYKFTESAVIMLLVLSVRAHISVENVARSDRFYVQSNVCFTKILAALSYYLLCPSSISTYTDAKKNISHITV